MIWLTLALAALSAPPSGQPWSPTMQPAGRIVTTSHLHLGVRPAVAISPDEVAVGATVQLTLNAL